MPVHLHFRGFPSPLMAEMHRRILLWVGDKAVLSIFGMRDFRVLRTEMASLKAVFLFEEKLFEQTAWLLETRPQNGAILSPAPVVILHGNSTVPDDAPSPTLVVHGTSPLQRTLHDWINAEYAFPDLRITEVNPQITFPDELQQLLLTEATERLMEIREQKILRGLIAGSALCHRAEHVGDVVVSWDDYVDVRQVLRSVATRPLDDAFDPMALAMVQRANAYMPVRQADIEGQGRPAENEVAGGFYDVVHHAACQKSPTSDILEEALSAGWWNISGGYLTDFKYSARWEQPDRLIPGKVGRRSIRRSLLVCCCRGRRSRCEFIFTVSSPQD